MDFLPIKAVYVVGTGFAFVQTQLSGAIICDPAAATLKNNKAFAAVWRFFLNTKIFFLDLFAGG